MADSSTTAPAAATSPARAATPASPKSAKSPSTASPAAGSPAAAAAPVNIGVLEADDGDNDGDSAYGLTPGDASDTTSVMSSIFRYRRENGRTYHAYQDRSGSGSGEFIPYWLPNDERETDRLDLQHNLCVMMQDNQLFISPAGRDSSKPIKRVLDGGCGTGIWAIDFADEHPEVAVVGIDISPIQPNLVPPNLEFFADDLERDWNFHQPFDLIYLRMMTGSIKDWPRLFEQSFQHLNPGGWIELCDIVNPLVSDDGTLEGTHLLRWNTLLVEATDNLGVSLRSPKDYKQQLTDAGFKDVTQVEFKWPINPWPKDPKHKELGAWTQENLLQAVQALSLMSFTAGLGWSVVEVETLLALVRKDLKNREIHAYWPIWVVYGQKPE